MLILLMMFLSPLSRCYTRAPASAARNARNAVANKLALTAFVALLPAQLTTAYLGTCNVLCRGPRP